MDKSVASFNIRLRTIKLRELFVGIIISAILTGVVIGIFPEVYENDDLFFIMLLSFVLLFFVWELRGTTGLSNNFKNLFVKKTRNVTENPAVVIFGVIFAGKSARQIRMKKMTDKI